MKLRAMNQISPTCHKLKNVHKLENIGHSDLVIFVCLALV